MYTHTYTHKKILDSRREYKSCLKTQKSCLNLILSFFSNLTFFEGKTFFNNLQPLLALRQRQWKRLFGFPNFGRFRDVSVSFTFVSFFRSQTFPETKIFRVPEKKRLFLERGYFKKRKRKRERKVVSTISALWYLLSQDWYNNPLAFKLLDNRSKLLIFMGYNLAHLDHRPDAYTTRPRRPLLVAKAIL